MYFGVPAMGAVVHTLNPRLHSDELSYIVNHAEDRAVIVDETLVGVFLEPVLEARDFEQVIVVSHSGEAPAGTTSYDELIGDAEAASWPSLDECQAAATCYTSGTTGRPKGVTYSHRSAVLHCLGAALPDALGISAGGHHPPGRPRCSMRTPGDFHTPRPSPAPAWFSPARTSTPRASSTCSRARG